MKTLRERSGLRVLTDGHELAQSSMNLRNERASIHQWLDNKQYTPTRVAQRFTIITTRQTNNDNQQILKKHQAALR